MRRLMFLAVLVATQAFAHHGWSGYDADRPLQLSGSIEESGYVHPHGFVRLKTPDKTWTVVLAPPTRMERRGISPDMIKPGKQVSVYGYPSRENAQEMRAERITIGQKTVELR